MKTHRIDIELEIDGATVQLTLWFTYVTAAGALGPEIEIDNIETDAAIPTLKAVTAVEQWLERDGYSKCVAIAEGL